MLLPDCFLLLLEGMYVREERKGHDDHIWKFIHINKHFSGSFGDMQYKMRVIAFDLCSIDAIRSRYTRHSVQSTPENYAPPYSNRKRQCYISQDK
jgi:hypothetical protein